MADRVITCGSCKKDFAFTTNEQEFLKQKGFKPPKRCLLCRRARRPNDTGVHEQDTTTAPFGRSARKDPRLKGLKQLRANTGTSYSSVQSEPARRSIRRFG